MKALKIVGLLVVGFLLLGVVLIALALTPSFQTWAVKRAVAGQPGMTFDVSRLAAGFSATDVADLRLTTDGIVVTAKGVSARYSAWEYLTQNRLNADSVTIEDLVVDLRNATAAKPAATPPGSRSPEAQPSKPEATAPFEGILKQAQLPFDVRVGTMSARGRALLPNEQVVTFELKGSGIETGKQGKIEWTVNFTDATTGAALSGLRSTGTGSVRITADRRIDLIEADTVAAAAGPGLPPDRVQLFVRAEQPAGSSNEQYATTVSLLRGNAPETILKATAQFLAASREIAGAWDLNLRAEQLTAVLTGLGLPEIAARGTGKFNLKPDTGAAAASGNLQGEVAKLEQVAPALAAIGSARFKVSFDGGMDADVAQLNLLELEATDGNGRPFAQISAKQKIGYEVSTQRITFANPNEELARISIQALPLAWAQPVVAPMVIESGDLSLILAINAEPDGSRVRARAIEPLSLRAVTVRQDGKPLVEQLTITLRPQVDYSATRITAELGDLMVSMPDGDSASGKITADITNVDTTPKIAFTTELKATLINALKPYLPAPMGTLTLVSSSAGQLEGDILQITRATTTVTRDQGVLLSSLELQQAVRADLKATTFTVPNPTATAVRMQLGEIPLAWAESFVEKSKLGGVLGGGVFEISMRSADDLTVTTVEPVTLRGVSATIDGQALAQNLDLSANLTATKRGETVVYDVRRIEVKQGETTLAGLNAAGQATLGAKMTVSAKGSLEANVAALMTQPALAEFATLSRGQVTANFEATMAETTQAKATLSARNLVAKQENRSLGDLEITLDAAMKADGSGSVVMPLTLTNAQRKSDLNVTATFGKAANRETFLFAGKVVSAQLVVDDFEPLAALAPASDPKKPAPTTKPGRDEKPFWTGVNGKLDLDLKRVVYGKDYVISNVLGGATITDNRLALNGLEGRVNENPIKLAAAVDFASQKPQPYALVGTANVTNLRVGEFLRAANPNEKPAIETAVTVVADLKGNGTNITDLAKNVYGRFDVTGSDGVLRALGRKGQVATGLSAALGIAGALTGSATTSAIGELTATFAELKFDSFKMQVERGADLALKLTSIEFKSPLMRTTGSGTLANRPGVAMQDQPMQIQLQFGAKGGLEHLLGRANALGEQADPEGYRLMQRNFTVGGTPSNPDSSALWSILLREAATRGAPALQDLLNRRK